MVNIPKKEFDFNGGFRSDPFIEFINETILLALENLLINGKIICKSDCHSYQLLSFKYEIFHDYFNIEEAIDSTGLIESTILKPRIDDGFVPSGEFLRLLINRLLFDEKYERSWRGFMSDKTFSNPWKELLFKILEQNRLEAWILQQKKNWWKRKVAVNFYQNMENNLKAASNGIELQCKTERANNPQFADLSYRLKKLIEEKVKAREYDTGGS